MTVIYIKRKITIGTAEDCDHRIIDEYASAHHTAVVVYDNDTFAVYDLGSTNGTWLHRWTGGQERITACTPVDQSATITVGRTAIPIASLLTDDELHPGSDINRWLDAADGLLAEVALQDADEPHRRLLCAQSLILRAQAKVVRQSRWNGRS